MIMDLILVGIFALTIFISVRRGFVLCLAKFTKGIVSVILSFLVCDDISHFLINRTPIGEKVYNIISSRLSFKWQQSDIYTSIPNLFKKGTSSFAEELIEQGSQKITELVLTIICFLAVLIILRTVLAFLVKVAKNGRKKKGVIGKLDWTLGLILGSVSGVFYVFLFLALLMPIAGLFFEDHLVQIMGWFDGSIFAQDLYDNNLLLLIFRDYVLK